MDDGPSMRWRDVPDELNGLSSRILDVCIEVHRTLGPGLYERHYKEAFVLEAADRGMRAQREVPFQVVYKGRPLGKPLPVDILVDDKIVLEAKIVDHLIPFHEQQLRAYLSVSQKRLGLLVNFHAPHLGGQIRRVVN